MGISLVYTKQPASERAPSPLNIARNHLVQLSGEGKELMEWAKIDVEGLILTPPIQLP